MNKRLTMLLEDLQTRYDWLKTDRDEDISGVDCHVIAVEARLDELQLVIVHVQKLTLDSLNDNI